MKNILLPILLTGFLFGKSQNNINPIQEPQKFKPDYSLNYFDQVRYWDAYYDSLAYQQSVNGDSTSKLPGLNGYNHWKDIWSLFMPSSGNFQDAFEVRNTFEHQKEYEYFLSYDTNKTKSLSPSINWEEIGPVDPTKILAKKTGTTSIWENPHVNNNGTDKWAGHVGKIDRLYQHPTIPSTIYATAGTLHHGGGGLFRSVDNGYTWENLGTNKILNAYVNSFAVKPIGEQPDPDNEYLYIAFGAGKIYRSKDDGLNWVQCDQSSPVSYDPFLGTQYTPIAYPVINQQYPLSLPLSDWLNLAEENITETNMKIVFAKNTPLSSNFARLIVARTDGLFYSNNSTADLLPDISNELLINKIQWYQFDFSSIYNQISTPTDPDAVDRKIRFEDIECFSKNGTDYYVAYFNFREFDNSGSAVGEIKQYVIYSTDYGANWSFLGGLSSPNSINGTTVGEPYCVQKDVNNNCIRYASSFNKANIEAYNIDPSYIYIGTQGYPYTGSYQDYAVFKYDIMNDTWQKYQQGSMYTEVGVQANGFAINQNSENDWWFYTNDFLIHQGGITTYYSGGGSNYRLHFHPDIRDVLSLNNGEILAATDGGIYRSSTGINFNLSSIGINCAESDRMAVAQSPPYYINSGFWHCGMQAYNPDTDIWHYLNAGDGNDGEIFFLNNEIFTVTNQHGGMSVYSNFNSLTNITGFVGEVRGSENIPGRGYGYKETGSGSNKQNQINFSNSDYASYTSMNLFTDLSQGTIRVIPNEPDLLALRDYNDGDENLLIYSGMNQVTPNPILVKTINAESIYGSADADLNIIVFDPRRNGICYLVLKQSPPWGQSSSKRIVEYNLNNGSYSDITFRLDDQIFNNQSIDFPTWMSITDLIIDRQTGILYLGTTGGIYYLDRDSQIWRKFSNNVPFFRAKLGIIHCTGEIYASTLNGGIWKAPLIRDEDHQTLEWNITSTNEIWEDRMNLFCTLVIKAGAKLTVKGDLVVYGDQKIIVEPGGKLYIDGGNITTECGTMWQGIELHGDASLTQIPTNQGLVLMQNNATIQYAYNGINVIGIDQNGALEWSKTGGIVRINDGNFKNCRRGIQFMTYQNFNTSDGSPKNNISYIHNCNFEISEKLPDGVVPYYGISMCEVDGVQIWGCTFQNTRSDIDDVPYYQRGGGIVSHNSTYKVQPTYNANGPVNSTKNTFHNLFKGVEPIGTTGQSSTFIRSNIFEGCEIAVNLVGSNFDEVVDNDIEIPNQRYGSIIRQAKGVVADHSSGYLIAVNRITPSPNGGGSLARASYITNTNIITGQYYSNEMTDITFGAQLEDDNSMFEIDCNEFTRNNNANIDIYHHNGFVNPQGINIASSIVKRNNAFINTCDPSIKSQINKNSIGTNSWYYIAQSGALAPDPIVQSCSDVSISFPIGGTDNNCPNDDIIPIVNGTYGVFTNFIKDHQNEASALSGVIGTIKNQLNQGDDESLLTLINSGNHGEIKNELLAKSPYLSDRILIAYLTMSQPAPPGHVKEVIIANSPVANDVLTVINQITLPIGIRNQIESAQVGTPILEATELSLITLEASKQAAVSAVVRAYIDSNWIDSARIYLENEGSISSISALIPLEFSKDTAKAKIHLETIRYAANQLMFEDPSSKQAKELIDFCGFYQSLIKVNSREGGIFSLTKDELSRLEEIAKKETAIASNARAILEFIGEKPRDYYLEGPSEKKNMTLYHDYDIEVSTKTSFEIYPNPSSGGISLTCNSNLEISDLAVYVVTDISGRQIDIIKAISGTIQYVFDSKANGVYLIILRDDTKILETQRVIINNL